MKIILNCKKAIPFSLSEKEILDMVDPEIMDAIKKREARPLLKAYVLAAEGNAYPEVITETGERRGGVVVWTKNAIRQVADAVKAGITKLFINHTDIRNQGEHPGVAYEQAKAGKDRVANAYVAASSIREYNGKSYNIIVAYFPEASRNQADDLDAVSMEVEYEAKEGGRGSTIVDKVLNIFGIALLKRDQDPAFEEARTVGTAFAHKYVGHYFQDDQTNQRPEIVAEPPKTESKKVDLSSASFDDLKSELIDRRKTHFWQLYDIDNLMGKPHKLRDGTIQYIGGDRKFQEHVLVMKEELKKELDQEYQDKLAEKDEKIKELEPLATEIKTYKALPVLDQKLEEMKLSPAVKAAVQRNKQNFQPGDDIEKDAEAFISKIKEEADFYAKQFGQSAGDDIPLGGGDRAEMPAEEKGILGVDDAE